MHYILDNWSFDPFLVIALVVVVWHEIGLRRLASRSTPERTRERRLRSCWFYSGLAVFLIAFESPIDYWAGSYFLVHMLQHLLLMFAAPSLVVAGAPWQPLHDALPWRSGPPAAGAGATHSWSQRMRRAGGFFLRPWVAIACFNLVMVGWHIPALFDVGESNSAVRVWLMLTSFFVAGVIFWLQFIPSPPFRSQLPLLGRAAALLATNVVMIIIAMSLSIFTNYSVYAIYNHVPGVTLPPFADQQIGAAILWVCGDFWALPTMIVTIRKLIGDEGGVGTAMERFLGRGTQSSTVRGWASSGSRDRLS
ncbi:cytochrome c oxidase assembly protein [Trebonia sp.]|uniref:cytochrome c oxidase assembly protein n=1 Tax=Trebonia sp. TaxID=2767075 RepID=UPI00260C41B0|nr:cytochrome c oxidase assembly protein [Trebonia sp.]